MTKLEDRVNRIEELRELIKQDEVKLEKLYKAIQVNIDEINQLKKEIAK